MNICLHEQSYDREYAQTIFIDTSLARTEEEKLIARYLNLANNHINVPEKILAMNHGFLSTIEVAPPCLTQKLLYINDDYKQDYQIWIDSLPSKIKHLYESQFNK
jgi:hypothetical protein